MNFAQKASPFLLFFLLLSVIPTGVKGQAGFLDYEEHPVLDYHFSHLEAALSLDEAERSLSGSASYTVYARHAFAEALTLHAAGLKIDAVLINDQEAAFVYENDRITLNPADYLAEPTRPFELIIFYRAEQPQALLRTAAGTLFTSLAPNRRAEWIPVFEHPRVAFTTRMMIEVPEEMQVVSNGYYFRSRSADGRRKQVIWRSEVPVPSTDLVFFAGNLEYVENLLGLTGIRVYGEARTGSQQVREELMRETISSLSALTRKLRVEYPFEGLTLVLLEDHLWEPRLSAASVGIVSAAISPIKVQIDRIVTAQWFGALLRPETVAGAGVHLLHQAALMQQLEPDAPHANVQAWPETDNFSYWDHLLVQHFHYWQQALNELDGFSEFILQDQMRNQLRREDPVGNWHDFQRVWYRASGRTLPETDFEQLRAVPEEHAPLPVQLVFGYSAERGISVTVDPQGPVQKDSIRVPLELFFRGGELRRDTLTVFRAGGEFVLPAESRPQNVIAGDGAPDFLFREMKDLSMWLHQLRNSPSVAQRVAAAQNLPRFREDPDIQLAVRDLLRAESSAAVRVALIGAIGDIVRGAAGTQQLFLDLVSTAEGEELLAALNALRNYPGNPAVVSAAGRLAQSAQYSEAAVRAVRIFREVASEEQFTELASSLLGGSGPAGIRAAVVEELFELSDRMVAVDTSYEIVLMESFPYQMRATALSALARNNRAPELQELVPLLIADTDPRMRLLALRYIGALDDAQMNNLLEQRFAVERDPRIRVVLEAF
ncbi:MAG: HEAT repeat domain-containing protein [Candidatus Cyclonatronum sp.]|uniref:HEAT repeat domain-containing protein n=1 Tax=Cyclonatronum sp. TaxID=3024185 RepID=UPI0025B87CB0|nr:HEAT repeat domain-containing protein [Cyclonatronum sp.]MCC5933295.1 HEAT repeat domain-containing protein [Balneolales bacterium]MCH8485383.1 HEAT repeat domain-containing protein [Cyclonatronum sp.]